jgi:hypothetical protein
VRCVVLVPHFNGLPEHAHLDMGLKSALRDRDLHFPGRNGLPYFDTVEENHDPLHPSIGSNDILFPGQSISAALLIARYLNGFILGDLSRDRHPSPDLASVAHRPAFIAPRAQCKRKNKERGNAGFFHETLLNSSDNARNVDRPLVEQDLSVADTHADFYDGNLIWSGERRSQHPPIARWNQISRLDNLLMNEKDA